MVLIPSTVGVTPVRAYTKSALLTASTTLLGPEAMLGSAGVVTPVLPEGPTFAIAASSLPPGNAPSGAGSDPAAADMRCALAFACDAPDACSEVPESAG